MAAGVCGREGCGLCGDVVVVGGSDARVPEGGFGGVMDREEGSERVGRVPPVGVGFLAGAVRVLWVEWGAGAWLIRGGFSLGRWGLGLGGRLVLLLCAVRDSVVWGAAGREGVEPVVLGVAAVGSLGGKAGGIGW